MVNIKKSVLSKVPVRSSKSAKLAAVGAGVGALFSRKVAIVGAGVGAYVGSVLGERSEVVEEPVVNDDVIESEVKEE